MGRVVFVLLLNFAYLSRILIVHVRSEDGCSACFNGLLTATPDQVFYCTCNEGYINKGRCECIPSKKHCGIGHITNGNKCECPEGYQYKYETCIPVCDPNCVNGTCTNPGKCICNNGYIETVQGNRVCEPECKQGCPNGRCTDPGVCSPVISATSTSTSTSTSTTTTTTTTPNPSVSKTAAGSSDCEVACAFGKCLRNRCVCDTGYEDHNGCVPVCAPSCRNATCERPNTCTCKPGHTFVSNSSSACTLVANIIVANMKMPSTDPRWLWIIPGMMFAFIFIFCVITTYCYRAHIKSQANIGRSRNSEMSMKRLTWGQSSTMETSTTDMEAYSDSLPPRTAQVEVNDIYEIADPGPSAVKNPPKPTAIGSTNKRSFGVVHPLGATVLLDNDIYETNPSREQRPRNDFIIENSIYAAPQLNRR